MAKKEKSKKSKNHLAKYRSEIDMLDRQIILALVKRFKVVQKITKMKKEQGISRRDKAREDQLLENYKKWSSSQFKPQVGSEKKQSQSQFSEAKLKEIRRLILKISRIDRNR